MRGSIKVLALLVVMTGCAQSPEAIQPSYVSTGSFENWSCKQLVREQRHVSDALTRASVQQEKAHTNDAVGVFLIGLPISSMAGENIAPQIANLKGQKNAIGAIISQKSCA